MRKAFAEYNFRRATLITIAQANAIVKEYVEAGYTLTLRQLYYQFVARGLMENTSSNYEKLGSTISRARLAGLVDWDAIEDTTRRLERLATWESPQDVLSAVVKQYRLDVWEGQDYRVEVWIEKEALVGVIKHVCRELRVPYFACRGYVSQSAQYEASKRMEAYTAEGAYPLILHLGDHDPSGIDMSRENQEKMDLMVGEFSVELRRLALNMDQVDEYNPPPNPAKETDSRHGTYVQLYGNESWELDALEPSVISQLIRDNVEDLIDHDKMTKIYDREHHERESLRKVHDKWDEVDKFVNLDQEDFDDEDS